MATYLICHGAWSAGWAWKKLRPLLRAAGHEVFTPSYTGLGERAHLAHPLVDLETHVQDILAVIEAEGLRDILLVGHSYGGMVATGVADRVPQLIRHLCYLDAFVPQDGQSLDDLVGSAPVAAPVAGWLVPPNPSAPDTAEADLAWTLPRRVHQPARCFSQKLRVAHAAPAVPRSYIHCTRKQGPDVFAQFADRFRADPAWRFHAMDASHSPNITAPEALAALLLGLG
ncbi:alpha/beta hydrolase [Dankookia rubra]|uniref:Alpha/beta hydrolase n=1 Tax=Dankookia rubra TaxID=1442381 RepID=A0A4R5QGI5_9PROT|nr:alpha/beta hydrolase family protein [Dankookia rubra]TDH61681.1 alpha/beta hydrolase [Dankookia rubra]